MAKRQATKKSKTYVYCWGKQHEDDWTKFHAGKAVDCPHCKGKQFIRIR